MNGERTTPFMLTVTAMHFAALFAMLHMAPAPSEIPVLSFTVTMMELSSSQTTVSTAASAASNPAEQSKPEKVEPIAKATPQPAKKKAVAEAKATPTPKTNAPLAHSSKQQTAVLAPTTPAQFDAAYLNNPTPVYPSLSRRLGEQGSVLLAVHVSEQGRADTVQLKRSSGFPRLDDAALDAVRRWRFVAAKQGEQLVASWVNVPVKFVLE